MRQRRHEIFRKRFYAIKLESFNRWKQKLNRTHALRCEKKILISFLHFFFAFVRSLHVFLKEIFANENESGKVACLRWIEAKFMETKKLIFFWSFEMIGRVDCCTATATILHLSSVVQSFLISSGRLNECFSVCLSLIRLAFISHRRWYI